MAKLVKIKQVPRTDALELLEVEQTAYSSGFYRRKPRKITASALLKGFYCMQQKGKNSLSSLAIQVGNEIGETVSKQAIAERFNDRMLEMVNSILLTALTKKAAIPPGRLESLDLGEACGAFNNIILQDSTVQQVNSALYAQVGGNQTSSGPRALFRIQSCYNLTKHDWIGFSVDPYERNDQSQSLFPMGMLEKRDLLIRDLGYFKLDALESLAEFNYFITALAPTVKLYDEHGQELSLLEHLRKHKNVDQQVYAGSSKRLPVRLVARKLSRSKTRKKIAKAKKNAHATSKHSPEYYELLGYEIYLTNIDAALLDAVQIAKLYGLRWYIEILFKSWKSHFNFKKMFKDSQMNYVRTIISFYLNLILFVYLQRYLYSQSCEYAQRRGKMISVLKFMNVISNLVTEALNMTSQQQLEQLLEQMAKHATYDKRNKRKNMIQKKRGLGHLLANVA